MVKIPLTCSLSFFVLQFSAFYFCLDRVYFILFYYFFFIGKRKAPISIFLSKRNCRKPQFLYFFLFLFLSPLPSNSRSPRPLSPFLQGPIFFFSFFYVISATFLSLSLSPVSFWNGFLSLLKFYLSVSIKIHLIKKKDNSLIKYVCNKRYFILKYAIKFMTEVKWNLICRWSYDLWEE